MRLHRAQTAPLVFLLLLVSASVMGKETKRKKTKSGAYKSVDSRPRIVVDDVEVANICCVAELFLLISFAPACRTVSRMSTTACHSVGIRIVASCHQVA